MSRNGSNAREIIHIQATAQEAVKLRVAGYARVSSDSDDQLNSFTTQVNHYTRFIGKNDNWELVEVYADEGVSGTSTEHRADFNRMIADCKAGKIDRIVTKSTSRFARNTMDSIGIVRELKSIGVSVYFEKENIDTAIITSENLLTLYSMFAEQESLAISSNLKKANRMRMSRGTYIASKAPYGYRLIDNKLQIHEEEAQIVRRIFSGYLAGQGVEKLARQLTEDEIPRNNGNPGRWHYYSVAAILSNEKYIGDTLYQKKFSEDSLPYNKKRNKGELPKYYVTNTHEPIIEKIEFELVRILMADRGGSVNKNCNQYTLSKKITCEHCGRAYKRKDTKTRTYWVCKKHDRLKLECPSQRITEESIYGAFVRMYNKLKIYPLLSQMKKRLDLIRDLEMRESPEMKAINTEIAGTSDQLHALTNLMSTGVLDSALFISRTDELKKQMRNLKQAKSRLCEESASDGLLGKTEELIEMMEGCPEYITDMDEQIFGEIVTKIFASGSEYIQFELINGLILTEELK